MSRGIQLVRLALVSGTAALALALAASPAAQAATPPATVFPYTFTNSDGTTTVVPAEPKRVVVVALAGDTLDMALSLGADVVGSAQDDYPTSFGVPWLNGGEMNGIAGVGVRNDPDYEAIAALHPDLIITDGYTTAEDQQLEAIAPVVLPPTSPPGTNPLSGQFQDQAGLLALAPLFNATARADQIVARLHQRWTTLAGFTSGTSIAQVDPLSSGKFNLVTSDQLSGGFLQGAGLNIQTSLPGATSLSNGLFEQASDELLSEVTASKVLMVTSTTETEADIGAIPTYPTIPAYATHQIYFTGWDGGGPVAQADLSTDLQKEVFGVSGLEATLSGTGKQKTSRSGIADVDIGPTDNRVCWDISTTGSIGRPNATVVENAKGVELFALGKGYHATGCANVKLASAKKLLSSPKYLVAIEKASTKKHAKTRPTVLLQGTVGKQTPAFFSKNGNDTQYNQ